MRLSLIAAAAVVTLLLPASASAQTTANFAFKHGEANYRTAPTTIPGAYQPGATPRAPCPVSGDPACTWEGHEFTIAPNEANGKFVISITWGSADDDWDLYVYKVRGDGTIDEADPVASSAQGGTTDETAILLSGPDAPIAPGTYRIIIDNWAAASPEWEGYAAFEPFVASNKRPAAALRAPAQATAGAPVTLDASPSSDVDGQIVNYAWDLDGNGSFETDGGASATREAAFPAGRANVAVRVRDDRGGVDYAAQTIEVTQAASPPGSPPGDQAPPNETFLPPPPEEIVLDLKRNQPLAKVFVRGVAGTVECPSACEIKGRLRIRSAVAERLGLGSRARTIARTKRSLSGDRSTPRVKLKPRARILRKLRRLDRVPAIVRISVVAEGFEPKRYRRPVTIVG